MTNETNYVASAFVSCSLRNEDKPFIDLVERILDRHSIKPIGTVGKYSAAPINPAEHMKQNIPLADIVVIVATPRYLQKDIQTGQVSYGLSEMVHVETGMAYMAGKPVVVFVQKGTHVGNFLPNITEYIELDGKQVDLQNKWSLITSLLGSAYKIVKAIKDNQASKEFGNFLVKGLAVWGAAKIVDELFADNKPQRRQTSTRRRR